jgi:hypothetical protein
VIAAALLFQAQRQSIIRSMARSQAVQKRSVWSENMMQLDSER